LKEVLQTTEKDADVTLKLKIGDGEIETTAEHPFYTQDGWKDAADLDISDTLQTKEKIKENIDSIEYSYKSKKVFNFAVVDWQTYFVGLWAWLVHNAKCISEFLIKGTQGLRHSFDRHAAQWFGGTVNAEKHLELWTELLERANKSKYVFNWMTGNSETIAKLAKIENKYFVIQFFENGERAGEVATAFVPTQKQLSRIFTLLK
jgi:hypothetical protein